MVKPKHHILEQARKLYRKYGIKSVTMDDVAGHLGISKKTLYEHFQDKEDIVRSILFMENENQRRFYEEILSKNLNSVEELLEVYKLLHKKFREYNPSMEYDIRKYYPDLYSSLKDLRRKELFSVLHDNLEKGKKEGFFREDLNARVIARLHVVRIENMFENDFFSIGELVSLQVFHEIIVYHMHGILSKKGMTFFSKNFKREKFSST